MKEVILVRNQVRKSNKGLFIAQTIKEVVDLVIIDGLLIKKEKELAERKGVARNTLHIYVKNKIIQKILT